MAIIERFIRSLKDECLGKVDTPFKTGAMLDLIKAYTYWYNEFRPHTFLRAATPNERYAGRTPVHELMRYEPRDRYPRTSKCAEPQAPPFEPASTILELDVRYLRGMKHLPIIELRRVA